LVVFFTAETRKKGLYGDMFCYMVIVVVIWSII